EYLDPKSSPSIVLDRLRQGLAELLAVELGQLLSLRLAAGDRPIQLGGRLAHDLADVGHDDLEHAAVVGSDPDVQPRVGHGWSPCCALGGPAWARVRPPAWPLAPAAECPCVLSAR